MLTHSLIIEDGKSERRYWINVLRAIFTETPGCAKIERIEKMCPFEVQTLGNNRPEHPFQHGHKQNGEIVFAKVLPEVSQ